MQHNTNDSSQDTGVIILLDKLEGNHNACGLNRLCRSSNDKFK